MTHVLFGECSGEAQIAGHLGFEQAVFPQVCINPICGLCNLKGMKRKIDLIMHYNKIVFPFAEGYLFDSVYLSTT